MHKNLVYAHALYMCIDENSGRISTIVLCTVYIQWFVVLLIVFSLVMLFLLFVVSHNTLFGNQNYTQMKMKINM